MGEEARETVPEDGRNASDPRANAMVVRVGERIAAASGRSDFHWEFKVIDGPRTVNASAFPGGKVAAYTGILPEDFRRRCPAGESRVEDTEGEVLFPGADTARGRALIAIDRKPCK